MTTCRFRELRKRRAARKAARHFAKFVSADGTLCVACGCWRCPECDFLILSAQDHKWTCRQYLAINQYPPQPS